MMIKLVLVVALCASVASAGWTLGALDADSANATYPVCDMTQDEAMTAGYPKLYTCSNTSQGYTRCCDDVQYVENSKRAYLEFVNQINAEGWLLGVQNFNSIDLECNWGWDNSNGCSTKNAPIYKPGTSEVVTRVTAYTTIEGCNGTGSRISSTTCGSPQTGQVTSYWVRKQVGVLRIVDVHKFAADPTGPYDGAFIGDKNERLLFDHYVEVLGTDTQLDSAFTVKFDTPVTAIGFYVRDASTQFNSGGVRQYVHVECTNNETGQFPMWNTNQIATDVTQTGRGDVAFWNAKSDARCDSSSTCRGLRFSSIMSQDHFAIDNLVVAHPGTSCNPNTISGYVYHDVNSNGVKNTAEAGLSSVQITLCAVPSGPCQSTHTDSTGRYEFTGLAPGQYNLTEPIQPGGFADGFESVGSIANGNGNGGGNTLGAVSPPDSITGISFQFGGNVGTNYNFGEISVDPCDASAPVMCYNAYQAGARVCKHNVNALGAALKWIPADDCRCTGATPCEE